ncbi:hypothetical protein DS901_07405 [Loktanella sp. D2R18]|uniref:YIP1 family protein n=1 Tax=Rhodobacterales TaxID=204455 RepID=UPI000DE911BE|nr:MULTISPECIES: YIP1 family protein [Rhodobacterales]MDO6589598.1 YIP1 family protein [Yoonia sp. 1_MG-2023]RBW44233.1 hypothetical protein DS901_07405 [Loktanella sp. D2R18]
MALTADIVRTWRAPRAVIRGLLDQGRREDRAVAFVMIACFLIFVAQWPRLSRIANDFEPSPWPPEINFEGMMTYTFYAVVIMLPLALYGLAAVARLLARVMGGQGSWYSARLALFWALLATTPLLLLHGLVRGFIGPGTQSLVVGAIWAAIFVFIWIQCMIESEKS